MSHGFVNHITGRLVFVLVSTTVVCFSNGLAQGEKHGTCLVVLTLRDLGDQERPQLQNHSHRQHRSTVHWDFVRNRTNSVTDTP
jgi:hypothetical protein